MPVSGFSVNPTEAAGGVLSGTYPNPDFAADMVTQSELDVAINALTYPTLATVLPSSPANGQICYFQADATNGVNWLLRYNSASASSYKWEFMGGADLYAEVTTSETTTSATYVALSTAGPAITLPLAGDFRVQIGARLSNNTASDGAVMSYDIGGTGASDNDAIFGTEPTSATDGAWAGSRVRRQTGLTAVTLTAKYKRNTGGTATAANRWMSVTPIRVG